MVFYEVMKSCNLGDHSQFETSNLNKTSHWINTNNTPWLGFLVLNNGDSWHFSFAHGLCKYVNIHSLKLDITKII